MPKLRFPGFEGEWESKLFRNVFSILPNNTLSRSELATNGEVLNVHYGDILVKYTSILDVECDEIPFIVLGKESKGCFYLQDGDIVVADTAEDEAVGKSLEITNVNGRKIESGLHTIPCRPNFTYAPRYLGYYINSVHFHRQLIPLMQGIKVLSVSKGNISKTVISAPMSIREQGKIASILHLLDCRLRKQQQIIDTLKKYKRGLLVAIFPEKGKDTPMYRLSRFTEPWEQHKLGEITNILSASRVHKEEWKTEGVPFFRSSDVMAAFKGISNNKVFISQELFEKLSAISGKPQQGDIFITGGGSIGTPYIVPSNEPLYSKDADLIWVKNGEKHEPFYLYAYFVSPIFREYLLSISHTGTIAHYTIEQVKKTPVYFPSLEEQQKIGEYFRLLDHLVTLHQRRLNMFEKIKSGMLQQLFI